MEALWTSGIRWRGSPLLAGPSVTHETVDPSVTALACSIWRTTNRKGSASTMDSATISFSGRLAADPDLRFNKSGDPWGKLRVMVNRRVRQRDQEGNDTWTDAPATALTVTVNGPLAVNIDESLRKGDPVMVTGRFYSEVYEVKNAETGESEERTDMKVRGEQVGVPLARHTARIRKADPNRPNADETPEQSDEQSQEASS